MGYAGRNGNCYGRGDYYRGDYYRGDYYRGDPGLLSGIGHFIGGAFKAVSTVANIAMNPVGSIAQLALKRLTASHPSAPSPMQGTALAPLPPGGPFTGQGIIQTGGLINIARENIGAPGMGMEGGGGPVGTMTKQGLIPVCGLKGTHVNKATYYKRAGDTTGIRVPKGSVCVKNRHMNPANGKALRRALRRAVAFKRIAMKSIRLLSPPGHKKKFGGFKTKGRARA